MAQSAVVDSDACSAPTPTTVHLARAIELAERRARSRAPQPGRRRGRRARRRGARRGLARRVRRAARGGQRDRGVRRRRPARRDAVRLARAVLPRRARRRRAPTRSSRPGIAPRRRRAPTTRAEKASGRGLGILRDEGVEVDVADGELAARARLLNQAFRKHARTGRPWVLFKSAMTLDGKVATRDRRLEVDLRRGQPRASRTAGARRSTRSRSASAPRSPTTRSSPRASTGVARASRAASSSTRPRACRWTRSSSRQAPEIPLDRRRLARRAALGDRRAGDRRRRRHRRDRRERARARALGARPARRARRRRRSCWRAARTWPGAFLDAGEIDEVRLFLAPLLLGGRAARDPLEGEGVERIAEALRALTLDCERVAERPADLRPAAGVVSAMFTGLVADLGTVAAVDATGDGARLSVAAALAARARARATRSRSTASA